MSKKQSTKDLQQKVDELTEALQRERADAINVRRRAEEQREELANFYKAMVVQELLPAIDNLERSLNHVPIELAKHGYVQGVQGVIKQFEKALIDLGIERIKTVGEDFDPRFHEAVQMEDAGGNKEVISEELQPGYKIGDEVIRHAKVKVKRG